jgi:hypothetical protein
MLVLIRRPLLLLFSAASLSAWGEIPQDDNAYGNRAAVPEAAAPAPDSMAPAPEKKNEIFFHPALTLLTVAIDQAPIALFMTYERHLENSKSFIWQPQLTFGDAQDGDIKITQFAMTSFFGLRKYARPSSHRGFYSQAALAGGLGSFDAERTGYTNKASGIVTSFGALAYMGYKWSHVFCDVGAGYQFANGTLEFDDGQVVEVSASGLAVDINLGFRFF